METLQKSKHFPPTNRRPATIGFNYIFKKKAEKKANKKKQTIALMNGWKMDIWSST